MKSKNILNLSVFFLVIIILFFSFYKILSYGIRIKNIHFGGISVQQLYLKLDNKFILNIKELNLQKLLSKPSSAPIDVEKIARSLRYFIWGISYFEKLSIQQIILDQNKIASIHYDGRQYKLLFPSINAIFDIQEDSGHINLDIQSLNFNSFVNVKGKIIYIPTRKEMAFNLNVIQDKNILSAKGVTDLKKIKLSLKSSPIASLDFLKKPLQDMDNPALKSWLFEKILFKNLTIESLSFQTTLNKSAFLPGLESSLKGKISIESPEIKLFKDVKPIKAQSLTAIFGEKKITLDSTHLTYGQMNLEGSQIAFKNFFSQPQIILDIKSPSFAYDSDLPKLLKHYAISVPLQKIDSPLWADLHLGITFLPNHVRQVDLNGSIITQKANLELYNLPLHADYVHVGFDMNAHSKSILIKTKGVSYYNMLRADLDGTIDLLNANFKTQANIHRIAVNTNQELNFKQPYSKSPSPRAHKGDAKNPQDPEKSLQSLQEDELDEERSLIDSHPETKQEEDQSIPVVLGSLEQPDNTFSGESSASASGENPAGGENPSSKNPAKPNPPAQAAETPASLSPKAESPNHVKLDKTFTKNPSTLSQKELKKLVLDSIREDEKPFTKEIIDIKGNGKLILDIGVDFKNHSNITIDIPKFSTNLTIKPNRTIIKLDDVSRLIPYSPLLAYLNVKGGNAYISTQDFKNFFLLFSINAEGLPLYDLANKRVKTLEFNGSIQDDTIEINSLDKKIFFTRKDGQNNIHVKNYNFNLNEFLDSKIPAIQEAMSGDGDKVSPTKEQIKNKMEFLRYKHQYQREHNIQAPMTNIQIDNMTIRYKNFNIPTDNINIRFRDQHILADATYKNGIANFDFVHGDIYIKANNFSADFVNSVIQKDIFNGGLFTLIGAFKNKIFNGELKIQNTLFKNFIVLQNIINLIDTIPSLIVFKNPNLGTKGYQVSKGSVIFGINQEYVGLEKIHLIGDSMDIDGNGIIQLSNQGVNVNLEISTIKSLGSIISKIPIVGFLVLGENGKISTNVTISGTLDNPKTDISLAEDIVTAPFKILRRVFTPIEAIVDEVKSEIKDEESNNKE